jgi:hypothetical protein
LAASTRATGVAIPTIADGAATTAAAARRPVTSLWKTCGRNVEDLCTSRQSRFFSSYLSCKSGPSLVPGAASHRASLARRGAAITIAVRVNIVRFQETINGRSYVIEVLPVGQDRWRAQIAGRPGGTTALMPFYGTTPAAAAKLLSGWLGRAGGPRPQSR